MSNGGSESQIVEDLVAKAAEGNRQAQTALLQRYWRLIAGVIHVRRSRVGKQVRAREDSVDMQQNIAIHLLQELPKHVWQSRRGFIAWLKVLTNAKVIDAQRHHMAMKRDAGVETGIDEAVQSPRHGTPGVETLVENRRTKDQLEAMLDQIKPEYAAAVRMHSLGFTHGEIADALDVPSEEAARKLVARGLSKLQKMGWGR